MSIVIRHIPSIYIVLSLGVYTIAAAAAEKL
jgi:hypothetical protein